MAQRPPRSPNTRSPSCGGYLLATDADWWRFLFCFWLAGVVGWLTYLGALAAGSTYGQLIRTAFDVHRGEVLTQLGLTEQPGLWPRLAQHWYRGIPRDAELEPDQPDAPTESRGMALPLGNMLVALALVVGVLGGRAGLTVHAEDLVQLVAVAAPTAVRVDHAVDAGNSAGGAE
jgi:hypothetical protein